MVRGDYSVMSGVECTARSVRGSYLTHACDRWRVTRATVGVAPPARSRINSVGRGGRGGAALACTPTAAAHGAAAAGRQAPRRESVDHHSFRTSVRQTLPRVRTMLRGRCIVQTEDLKRSLRLLDRLLIGANST